MKLDNYLKDNNRLYERYRIISSMDEYMDYLKRVTSFKYNGDKNESNYHEEKGEFYNKRNGDSFLRKKRGNNRDRNYKDLDDVQNNENNNNENQGRNLISYDDL